MGFCWIKRKQLYSMDDIQDMLNFLNCHKSDKETKAFIKFSDEHSGSEDALAIRSCIEACWYEEFYRYDSAVRENFVVYFEELFIINKKYNNHKPTSQFVVVTCNKEGKYGVVDRGDFVVDYFSKEELINIAKSGISIDGVDTVNNEVKVM